MEKIQQFPIKNIKEIICRKVGNKYSCILLPPMDIKMAEELDSGIVDSIIIDRPDRVDINDVEIKIIFDKARLCHIAKGDWVTLSCVKPKE